MPGHQRADPTRNQYFNGYWKPLPPVKQHQAGLPTSLKSQLQSYVLVEPIDAFMVDCPALPLKQNLDATVTVANSGSSEVSDSNPQSGLVFGLVTISNHRPTDSKNSASSSLANFKADLQVTDKILPDGRLQSFLRSPIDALLCLGRDPPQAP
jgi:hypothetical protein